MNKRCCSWFAAAAVIIGAACDDDTRYATHRADEHAPADEQEDECTALHWTQTYDGLETQQAMVVRTLPDGFVFGGAADAQDGDFRDAWMLRSDGRGDALAEYLRDGPDFEQIQAVFVTDDQLVGFGQADFNAYDTSIAAWRSDLGGEHVERFVLGSDVSQRLLLAHPALDGNGFVLFVQHGRGNDTEFGYRMVQLDAAGEVISEQHTPSDFVVIRQVLPSADGSILVARAPLSDDGQRADLLRFGPDGQLLNRWASEGPSSESIVAMATTGDEVVVALETPMNRSNEVRFAHLVALSPSLDRELWRAEIGIVTSNSTKLQSRVDGAIVTAAVEEQEGTLALTVRRVDDGDPQRIFEDPRYTLPVAGLMVSPGGTVWITLKRQLTPAPNLDEAGSAMDLVVLDDELDEPFIETLVDGYDVTQPLDGAILSVGDQGALVTVNRLPPGEGGVVVAHRRDLSCFHLVAKSD